MAYTASAPQGPKMSVAERLQLHPSDSQAFAPAHLQHLALNLCRAKGRDIPKMDYSDTWQVGNYLLANFSASEIEAAHIFLVEEYRKRKSRGPYSRKPSTKKVEPITPDMGTTLITEPATSSPSTQNDMSDYVRKPHYSADMDVINNNIKQMRSAVTVFSEETGASIHEIYQEIQSLKDSKPLVIEIKRPDTPAPQNIGIQHKQFPQLVAACNAIDVDGKHLNIYIHGPAATGKSYACKQINKAIYNGKYPMRGSGQTLLPHEFMGYFHGDKYVRSQFRDAFEHGGFFFADEFDRYSPGATVALNNCLAGNEAAFPDGMVERHPDFIFIACGNTRGAGATMEYSTAQKQDAATKNRFIDIDWPIDEAIEDAMCYNKDWLALVRKVRQGVESRKLKGIMVTPRQTAYGQALISAGFTIEQAADSCLRQGMDDNQWYGIAGKL